MKYKLKAIELRCHREHIVQKLHCTWNFSTFEVQHSCNACFFLMCCFSVPSFSKTCDYDKKNLVLPFLSIKIGFNFVWEVKSLSKMCNNRNLMMINFFTARNIKFICLKNLLQFLCMYLISYDV